MQAFHSALRLPVLALALLLGGSLVAPYLARTVAAQAFAAGCEADTGNVPALIAAIGAANETAEADTITLGPCTYTLADPFEDDALTGLPPITAPLTILGNGATVERARSAQPFRLIKTTAPLTLARLTLRGGRLELGSSPNLGLHAGGAIWNLGTSTLTLNEVQLNDNMAHTGGAISSGGPVMIGGGEFYQNNAVAGCGGAIYSDGGNLTVTATSFYGNDSKGAGGAICVEGATATIDRASFVRNSAAGEGAVLLVNGQLALERSYLNYNSQARSMLAVTGSATIRRNRFLDNHYQQSALALDGRDIASRITNNLWVANRGMQTGATLLCLLCAGGSSNITVEYETMVSAVKNDAIVVGGDGVQVRNSIISGFERAVVGDGVAGIVTRRNIYYPPEAQHEVSVGTSTEHIVADPQFVSPDDWDFRLLAGSPARDAAIHTGITIDLPGLLRPLGGTPDIGAYEHEVERYLPAVSVHVPCSPDRHQQLIDAILRANAQAGATRIALASGCVYSFTAPYANVEALPPITEWLAIDGNGATLRRDPASTSDMRLLQAYAPLVLRDLIVEGGRLPGWSGGAVELYDNFAHLYGENLVIRDSTAEEGAALSAWGSAVELQGGLFERNSALGDGPEDGIGAAISLSRGRLTLRGTRFLANSASGAGGALALFSTIADIDGARFEQSVAPTGSAIFARNLGSARIVNTLLLDSRSASGGAAAHLSVREHLLFAHNTLVGGTQPASRALELEYSPPNLQPEAGAALMTATARVWNNIIAVHPEGVSIGTGLTADLERNLYFQSQPRGAGQIVADPRFVSPATGDYTLAAGSPAIDGGLALDGIGADYSGVARPQGTAPDLGAYEFTTQNLRPVAADDLSYATSPGEPLRLPAERGVLANDRDPNGDPLDAVLHEVLTPAGGQVALAPDGSFSYTPAPGFSGSFRFSYTAGDGTHRSAPATVNVRVEAGVPASTRYRVALPLVRR